MEVGLQFDSKMKKYQIAKPFIKDDDIKSVVDVLKSGWLSLGPRYEEFEKQFAKYLGVKYALAVSNGTCGLHLAVRALGLEKGDEVITSPFSFISSSNCLIFEGVKPVFADIEETTFNIDPSKIERLINSKTRAILPVDIFGQSVEMDPILKIAKKYKLKILEDSCESLGATYKGRMVGTGSDVAVFAFYPNKQMTTGEGGMIVTNSKKIYELCDSMRNQGRGKSKDWLVHERLGFNYRMDEMSAALGITQLKKIGWMIDQKIKIASWYNKVLKNVKGVEIPKIGPDRSHTFFVYVIRVKNKKRNMLMDALRKFGIQTKPYLPVIHLQPFMEKMFSFKKGDFPIAEKISGETLALPLYIGLSNKDIEYISFKINKILNG